MDGIDLIDAYRKEKPGQHAIFMTGYAVEEKLKRALQDPHSISFNKPFDIHALARTVSQYFQNGSWEK
jgi:CheY-like chemotaxis protein